MALLLRSLASALCKAPIYLPAARQNCSPKLFFSPSRLSSQITPANRKTISKPSFESTENESEENSEFEVKSTSLVISNVNQQIQNKSHGRLFAIVYLNGKQFKVTTDDILVVDGYWPPSIGDKLLLRKILLVGGSDFTLIGRPMLPHGQALVEATVIEKTMSHTRPIFRKKRRKQYMRINFSRVEYTLLRINSIEITENVNVKKDVEGLEENIF